MDWNAAMNRRTKGVFLVGGLAVATIVTTFFVLSAALARVVDPHNSCETGFSTLITCKFHRLSRTVHQGEPVFPPDPTSAIASDAPRTVHPDYAAATSWGVALCPQNHLARRLLCAIPSVATPVEAASDDLVTGLPRPKPWLITTAEDSPFIKAFHVETPLGLAAALGFYRAELNKRGWTENDGAVVAPDRAVIAFTTPDGPAQLRLARQDDRTVADLSLRKSAATSADILPRPGQVRLRLGNDTDEEAVITINDQTITLAARAGSKLTDDIATGRKSPDSPEINLPPGKYKVALKIASGPPQNREFDIAADETWGLLVGPGGIPLPVHLY
jgi:hypothetical protein